MSERENAALFKRLIIIHSNSPILYSITYCTALNTLFSIWSEKLES